MFSFQRTSPRFSAIEVASRVTCAAFKASFKRTSRNVGKTADVPVFVCPFSAPKKTINLSERPTRGHCTRWPAIQTRFMPTAFW